MNCLSESDNMYKIGFIGFGNMAQAIITGLISSGNFNSTQIGAYDINRENLEIAVEKLNITAYDSNDELVKNSDCVILAVKPNTLQNVLTPISDSFCKADSLVISIAAGQSIDKLKSYLGYDAAVVRVMPNINAIAGQAVSGFVCSDRVTEIQSEIVKKILSSFGTFVEVDEDKFSAYSAIAGCSPAYSYLFIDTIARVGVRYGLTKKESLDIVTSTVIETIKKSDLSKSDLLENVVVNAIEKAYNKDKGIGK